MSHLIWTSFTNIIRAVIRIVNTRATWISTKHDIFPRGTIIISILFKLSVTRTNTTISNSSTIGFRSLFVNHSNTISIVSNLTKVFFSFTITVTLLPITSSIIFNNHHSHWADFAFDNNLFTNTTTLTVFNVSIVSWTLFADIVRAIFWIVNTLTTYRIILEKHHSFWTNFTMNFFFNAHTAALTVFNVIESIWASFTLNV
jgi:hypothetical protein